MTQLHTPVNQTVALAGLFQAVQLCKNLAQFGRCDADQLGASLQSILVQDADNVSDVYHGFGGINKGLRLIRSQLTPTHHERDLDITRHCISLIQLGDNLISNNETVDQLRAGIDKAQQLDFNILDEVMINHLANLYRNSISHLSPRIVISGQQQYLNNELVAAKIRASLLAGLRSVVLWRQCGGTRLGLLLSRAKYMRVADGILRGGSAAST